jgi:uncharacterized membrane protein YphA (DoxX/SURF4 family)
MNILLWVLQVLLAAAFLAHGLFFLFPPASMLELLKPIPTPFRLFLGLAEVLAAVGLTVPGITRIQPILISWAAAGVTIIMIGATVFHVSRGELSSAVTTAILLAMASYVAYMRWKVMPIRPRTTV